MTVNLNHAIAQGFVVSVNKTEKSTRLTLVTRNDYKDRDGDWVERAEFLPITFYGIQGENLAKLVEKGAYLTVSFRVSSFKPQDSEYHVLSLVGEGFFLAPRQQSEESSAPAQRQSNGGKKPQRQVASKRTVVEDEDVEDDDDTWDALPPWPTLN